MTTKRKVIQLPIKKIVEIGSFAGVFWGIIFLFIFYFNLSEFGPSILLKICFSFEWIDSIWGQLIGIGIIAVTSIIISIIYYKLFKRLEGMFPGIIMGIVCFLFFSYVTKPFLTESGNYAAEFGLYTVVAMACIFVLWGVTITYSISFEANNETLPGSIYSKRN